VPALLIHPDHSPNHHQRHKPALCRDPARRGRRAGPDAGRRGGRHPVRLGRRHHRRGGRLLIQANPEPGDGFGWALAAVDSTDLAVGVPGEDVGGAIGAGAVSLVADAGTTPDEELLHQGVAGWSAPRSRGTPSARR
jgi:hypothetical protein